MTTRNERIRTLLASSEKPMTIAEIANDLKEAKNKVAVANHCRLLWQNGEIERCNEYQQCSVQKKPSIAYFSKSIKTQKPNVVHAEKSDLPELVKYVLTAFGFDQNQLKLVELIKNMRKK